jgi:hypothetical protein
VAANSVDDRLEFVFPGAFSNRAFHGLFLRCVGEAHFGGSGKYTVIMISRG